MISAAPQTWLSGIRSYSTEYRGVMGKHVALISEIDRIECESGSSSTSRGAQPPGTTQDRPGSHDDYPGRATQGGAHLMLDGG